MCQTPMPLSALVSEPAKAWSAPGPIDVTTAARSPVAMRSALAAWAASVSWRSARNRTALAAS